MASRSQAEFGFGPTLNGKMYISLNQHRHFAHASRNRWAQLCPPQHEFATFSAADLNDWRDSRPHLWGIQPGLSVLGCDGECIALFRRPTNKPPDPWHGYPVSALDRGREYEHRPEPRLVDVWVESGLINTRQGNRINRGKV
jgi:hypothetical protein